MGKRPTSPPRSRNQAEAGPIDGMRPPFRIRRAGGNPAQEASHAEGRQIGQEGRGDPQAPGASRDMSTMPEDDAVMGVPKPPPDDPTQPPMPNPRPDTPPDGPGQPPPEVPPNGPAEPPPLPEPMRM